jgi:biotin carboxyl carrier protein
MKYYVTIGDRTRLVVVDGEEILVDGEPMRAELLAIPHTPLRHLLVDRRSTTLAVAPGTPAGRWTLVVGGDTVEAEVVDERTRHIRGLVGAGRRSPGGGEVKAPMPGLVTRVLVEVGQAVTAGQGLVILEAMKMENELKAPAAGVVAGIRAVAGGVVERGAVLVELALT